MENKFLEIAKKLQSIAQIGLTFANSPYDEERYAELRKISFEMMSMISNTPVEKITDLFEHEKGYQTPKVDVRGIIFRGDKILMVQEKADRCWTPPGGWSEIGLTPYENVCKEIWEEAGLKTQPVRLLAVLDKKCHAHPATPWYSYKLFILCEETGGKLEAGTETLDAQFFGINELPELSIERVTKEQIEMMFEYMKNPDKPAICD
jgi:ADP-ribose pyrophosphatase YjhB (NUDIX family)